MAPELLAQLRELMAKYERSDPEQLIAALAETFTDLTTREVAGLYVLAATFQIAVEQECRRRGI